MDIDEEPDLLQPESPKTRTVRFVQTKDNFQIIVTTDGFVGITLVGSDDDILKLLNVFIEVQSYLYYREVGLFESLKCNGTGRI